MGIGKGEIGHFCLLHLDVLWAQYRKLPAPEATRVMENLRPNLFDS